MSYKDRQFLSGESGDAYDVVPDYCFDGVESILDIGSMSGFNAILSRHREKFVGAESRGEYLGVDILEYPKYYLKPFITSDIMDFDTDTTFDLVLALHLVEHLPIELWPELFAKLKGLVSDGGYLVVSTPYKQVSKGGVLQHSVFGIREKTFEPFLDGVFIIKRRRPYRLFRTYDEGYLWPSIRFVLRILTRHQYRYGFNYKPEIMAIWKNEKEIKE